MKILVIGSGGREHALCLKFKQSAKVTKIFCAEGNAGISAVAECVEIKPHEIEKLADFAEKNFVDLTFVGGETALSLGIVDEFENRNLAIIGPNRSASRLEASKSFAKDFMLRHSIPTAKYRTANSIEQAREILESGFFGNQNAPVVVKADGLAAGKGVVVARNRAEALAAINRMHAVVGSEAAAQIVLEQCLTGDEVSFLLFSDGRGFKLMPPVRDHKRIGEGDTGANTGGMGTFAANALLSRWEVENIVEEIVKPTLEGCRQESFPFRGILFLGLMMTGSGAKLLEYNVRFGDPEAQSILALLETDLVEICQNILSQTLDKVKVDWLAQNAACVVLAAENYPQKPVVGAKIQGIGEAEKMENVRVFHAGTKFDQNGNYLTAGGRVLGITATGEILNEALAIAYRAVDKISWKGMQFRRDIGK